MGIRRNLFSGETFSGENLKFMPPETIDVENSFSIFKIKTRFLRFFGDFYFLVYQKF